MKLKVGYPEAWADTLDKTDIRSSKNGGSYFKNMCEINKAMAEENRNNQQKPVDKSRWHMAAYEVNAYYDFTLNEIVFPAGILQAPFYSLDAPLAKNLGEIGVVIAHEISHAFDNSGSKFDENGNAKNWWTKEDSIKFEERCKKIIAFYDGIEIIPGVMNNGKLTLGENIADLEGVGCALELLSQSKNPDYQTFFKAYADSWRGVYTDEFLEYISKADVHSNNKVRVNQTVMNFEEFYKAFGITEGDKMYVAPENRVSLW